MRSESAPDVCDRFARSYVRKVARQLIAYGGFSQQDRDDVIQELTLAVVECRDSYDPAKSRWTYFVKLVVDRKAVSLRRARSAQRRGNSIAVSSLNVYSCNEFGQLLELAQQVLEQERGTRLGIEHQESLDHSERTIAVAEALAQLPEDLAHICRLLREKSVADAARELGIPRTTLIYRLAAIREHFEQAGLDPSAD